MNAPREPLHPLSSDLRAMLEALQRGERSVDETLHALGAAPRGTDLGFAVVDHDRAQRCGFPEVVFCQGKEPAHAAAIAQEILTRSDRVLLTRADEAHAAAVTAAIPHAVHHRRARCITVAPTGLPEHGLVAVVAAGTADLPVAEEVVTTLRFAQNRVETHFDVGVAGLHRLLDRVDSIRRARAVVVVAGMEGALVSVVAGLVATPVVAVPTSVGYGASFAGLSALLTMLNSCAAGVAVVNIDNGFGAGYLASQINQPPAAAAASNP